MITELAVKLPSHHAVTSFMAGKYGQDLFGLAIIVLLLIGLSSLPGLFSRPQG